MPPRAPRTGNAMGSPARLLCRYDAPRKGEESPVPGGLRGEIHDKEDQGNDTGRAANPTGKCRFINFVILPVSWGRPSWQNFVANREEENERFSARSISRSFDEESS